MLCQASTPFGASTQSMFGPNRFNWTKRSVMMIVHQCNTTGRLRQIKLIIQVQMVSHCTVFDMMSVFRFVWRKTVSVYCLIYPVSVCWKILTL